MTETEFRDKVTGLTRDEKTDLGIRLRHLIDQRTRGIEYAEGRRSFFINSSAALFAAGIALLGLTLTKPLWLPFACLLGCLGVSFPLLSVAIWIVHASHLNFNYPFTRVASVPKWFYRYALLSWKSYHIPWVWKINEKQHREDQATFGQDYILFLANSTSHLLDPVESLVQDIKQIYLLHVNEMYKNQFLTKLRRVFQVGLLCVGGIAVLALSVGYLVDSSRWPAHDRRQQSSVTMHAVWAPPYRTSATTGNFNLQVSNKGTSMLAIEGLAFTNELGLSLPFEVVQCDTRFPIRLEPGGTIRIAALVEFRGNRLSSVRRVGLRL